MNSRKSQAAMEFLLNYGWIILAVIVVIGALMHFGVLEPSSLLPEKCIFKTGFSCTDHTVQRYDGGGGAVQLRIKNNLGDHATITGLSSDKFSCSMYSGEVKIASGDTDSLTLYCSESLSERGKVSMQLEGDYYTHDPGLSKDLYGELTGKATTVPAPPVEFEIELDPAGPMYTTQEEGVSFDIILRNKGFSGDTYDLYVSDTRPAEDQECEVPDFCAHETMSAEAGGESAYTHDVPGEHLKLGPESEPVSYMLYIKAVSQSDEDAVSTARKAIRVVESLEYDFNMRLLTHKTAYATEEEPAEYEIELSNTGGLEGEFKFSFEDVSETNPEVEFSDNDFTLVNGYREIITVEVMPPEDSTPHKLNIVGTLSADDDVKEEQEIDELVVKQACTGYTMNEPESIDFFNSRINFEGDVITEDPDADSLLPSEYEVNITKESGGVWSKMMDDPASGKFNIVETGLPRGVEITPVHGDGDSMIRCENLAVSKSPIKSLDPDGLEIERIWKVWDDGPDTYFSGGGISASRTGMERYSGVYSLEVEAQSGPKWTAIPQIPSVTFDEAEYLVYAIKNKKEDETIWAALELHSPEKRYYVGDYVCGDPGGSFRDGGYRARTSSSEWRLNKIDLSTPTKKPEPCIVLDEPTGAVEKIQISTTVSSEADPYYTGYYDTIYFYTVK